MQGEKELEKPSGVHASHIGNVELKPMDGGGAKKPAAKLAKPQPEAEAVAAPLAAPQHEKHEVARGEEDAMVEKVLDSVDSMPAVQQSVEQQQPEQQQPEQQQPEQEQPVQPKVKVKEKPLPAPAEPEQQPGGGEEAKEADDYTPEQSQDSAAGAATGMQQVEKERPQQPASPAVPEQQQQPESGAGGGASGEEEEDYTPDEAQGSSTEAQQQQQPRQVEPKAVEDQEQPPQQQQQSQEMEVEEQSVPPTNRPIIKATRSCESRGVVYQLDCCTSSQPASEGLTSLPHPRLPTSWCFHPSLPPWLQSYSPGFWALCLWRWQSSLGPASPCGAATGGRATAPLPTRMCERGEKASGQRQHSIIVCALFDALPLLLTRAIVIATL